MIKQQADAAKIRNALIESGLVTPKVLIGCTWQVRGNQGDSRAKAIAARRAELRAKVS